MTDWVKLKDEIPPLDTWVLFYDGRGTMGMGEELKVFTDKVVKSSSGLDCVDNYLHNYTHWQPLPEPPEGF